ncbi:DUF1109 domain-containing protein [Burkholderia glumae]|uniref:DUF1109 domain-containing protein n=1 Tax=Burkholderia glumae TaxID=337 RepID=UPI000C271FA6|nr:DUF1109 domain-containing protein [Burkholderia glumae]MCM2495032.1 DUF1109 domain-containing protein [Burkholderia glumae]MCM2551709.1 DUF1109 domain-containing protein [Burkholderia glumae]MCR1768703.1 DUF1109 domain-containing protein [Burkholderia glumae]NVE25340.1 DUF1109 domain-containing protein [Burkholderia glumae]PJO21014.1 anti-sigma F factor [Burkholderia glumae AU6208]
MKTDDLISMLATGVTPADPRLPARRFATALAIGAAGALLLMAALLGVRRDLAEVALTPLFWAKLALPLALAIGALATLARLARPGARAGRPSLLIAAPVAVAWIAALAVLAAAPAGDRLALVLGSTWQVCPWLIALLSVPGLVAILAALRRLAPTRLALAGGVGGLLSGAVATLVYCLHCPEMGVPFWSAWYLLGMLVPSAAGAAIGPRVLRW